MKPVNLNRFDTLRVSAMWVDVCENEEHQRNSAGAKSHVLLPPGQSGSFAWKSDCDSIAVNVVIVRSSELKYCS